MAYTQEDLQEWIFFISDKLDYMTDTFAKDHGLNLDFSVESINALEEWMLAHYSSPQDLINDPRMHDLLTVYIGETYRHHLGGHGSWIWRIKRTLTIRRLFSKIFIREGPDP